MALHGQRRKPVSHDQCQIPSHRAVRLRQDCAAGSHPACGPGRAAADRLPDPRPRNATRSTVARRRSPQSVRRQRRRLQRAHAPHRAPAREHAENPARRASAGSRPCGPVPRAPASARAVAPPVRAGWTHHLAHAGNSLSGWSASIARRVKLLAREPRLKLRRRPSVPAPGADTARRESWCSGSSASRRRRPARP